METWGEMLFSSKPWAPFCHLQKYPLLYLGPYSQALLSRMFLRLFLSFNIFFLPPGEIIKHLSPPNSLFLQLAN